MEKTPGDAFLVDCKRPSACERVSSYEGRGGPGLFVTAIHLYYVPLGCISFRPIHAGTHTTVRKSFV